MCCRKLNLMKVSQVGMNYVANWILLILVLFIIFMSKYFQTDSNSLASKTAENFATTCQKIHATCGMLPHKRVTGTKCHHTEMKQHDTRQSITLPEQSVTSPRAGITTLCLCTTGTLVLSDVFFSSTAHVCALKENIGEPTTRFEQNSSMLLASLLEILEKLQQTFRVAT